MCAQQKKLIAFDFDYTLINENSDTYINKLAPEGEIPEDIAQVIESKGWTEYMRQVFVFLHQNSVTPNDYTNCLEEIELMTDAFNLLSHLCIKNYDIIVISDANSYFIDTILRHNSSKGFILETFTNPAKFDEDGCLRIEEFENQDSCSLCSKNMCKGTVLTDFIEKRKQEEVIYEQVIYVGDGKNDLCPSLRLSSEDIVFARRKYRLSYLLRRHASEMKAKVIIWKSSQDIFKALFVNPYIKAVSE